jgi:CMP-N-acetylneuraminic acid synthetase
MRHHSERVPGKNYRDFAGLPLYAHIVSSLARCEEIDQVVIDTDSPVIMEDAARRFPEVLVIERPEPLRDGMISMNDVLCHTVAHVDAEHFLQTHSTNPLLRPETISRAIQDYFSPNDHDSLFSVTRLQTRLYDQDGRPLNHDPAVLLRTQDLPPIFEENSNLYIFPRELLLNRRARIGLSPLMFEVEKIEAWDIDDESDFLIAEEFCRKKLG